MIYLFLSLFLSLGVFASDQREEITVIGKCDVQVVPDRGSVTITAENQSKDQKVAVAKTTKEINALKTQIESLSLKDLELKNTSYLVTPVKEWEKDKMVDKGMRASLSLVVATSEISRLGEVMRLASKIGIVNVGALTTFLSDQKSKDEHLRCLDIAAEDAGQKASKLAKKLGFKLGPVVHLLESPSNHSPGNPVPMRAMMKGAQESDTSIEAGSESFKTTIQVSYKIK